MLSDFHRYFLCASSSLPPFDITFSLILYFTNTFLSSSVFMRRRISSKLQGQSDFVQSPHFIVTGLSSLPFPLRFPRRKSAGEELFYLIQGNRLMCTCSSFRTSFRHVQRLRHARKRSPTVAPRSKSLSDVDDWV